jgi:hypothetical protein
VPAAVYGSGESAYVTSIVTHGTGRRIIALVLDHHARSSVEVAIRFVAMNVENLRRWTTRSGGSVSKVRCLHTTGLRQGVYDRVSYIYSRRIMSGRHETRRLCCTCPAAVSHPARAPPTDKRGTGT